MFDGIFTDIHEKLVATTGRIRVFPQNVPRRLNMLEKARKFLSKGDSVFTLCNNFIRFTGSELRENLVAQAEGNP